MVLFVLFEGPGITLTKINMSQSPFIHLYIYIGMSGPINMNNFCMTDSLKTIQAGARGHPHGTQQPSACGTLSRTERDPSLPRGMGHEPSHSVSAFWGSGDGHLQLRIL